MTVPDRPEGALLDRTRDLQPGAIETLLAPKGNLLVVAPHPDDETLGCGQAIREAVATGREATIVLLTGGGGSHPASRSHPVETMKALRRKEFASAIAALEAGLPRPIDSLQFDLPDGSVAHNSDGLADVERQLVELIAMREIGTVWCSWAGDPHGDHRAASALIDRVQRRHPALIRFDYAIWGRFGANVSCPPTEALRTFEAGRHRAAKRAAMDCYVSQLTPSILDDPDGFTMPPALVEHFAGAPEIFIRVELDRP